MGEHLVIIPTYNESDNIVAILDVVLKLPGEFSILVVDDGSPDGTAGLVKASALAWPERVFLLERTEKSGVGMAYVAGFQWAIAHGAGFVYELDADFSHPPESLVDMAQLLSEQDQAVVVGSRYIGGVRVINWPMRRLLLSYFASKYTRICTRLPIYDTTAGFVGYRVDVLKAICLEKLQFKGYFFQIIIKYLAWRRGFRLFELPIIFSERRDGQTKMSSGIFWEALFWVLVLPLVYRRYLR